LGIEGEAYEYSMWGGEERRRRAFWKWKAFDKQPNHQSSQITTEKSMEIKEKYGKNNLHREIKIKISWQSAIHDT
jgi:hypothetical protein